MSFVSAFIMSAPCGERLLFSSVPIIWTSSPQINDLYLAILKPSPTCNTLKLYPLLPTTTTTTTLVTKDFLYCIQTRHRCHSCCLLHRRCPPLSAATPDDASCCHKWYISAMHLEVCYYFFCKVHSRLPLSVQGPPSWDEHLIWPTNYFQWLLIQC